jgi:hypothetical protein
MDSKGAAMARKLSMKKKIAFHLFELINTHFRGYSANNANTRPADQASGWTARKGHRV